MLESSLLGARICLIYDLANDKNDKVDADGARDNDDNCWRFSGRWAFLQTVPIVQLLHLLNVYVWATSVYANSSSLGRGNQS